MTHIALDAALAQFGCTDFSTLDDKKRLVAQELHSRMMQVVLRDAVQDIGIKNTSARKM
jgi:hypothetical protein